jgi:hypothetical protein
MIDEYYYGELKTMAIAIADRETIQLERSKKERCIKFRLSFISHDFKNNIHEEFIEVQDACLSFIHLMMVKFKFSEDMYITFNKDGSHTYQSAAENFKVYISDDINIVLFQEETQKIIDLTKRDSVVYTKYGVIK